MTTNGHAESGVAVIRIGSGDIDLAATLDGGQAFRWWPDDGWLRGVIGNRVVRMRAAGGVVEIQTINDRDVDILEPTIRDYLGLGFDLDAFKARFADDPCIGPAVRGFAGLRLLRQDPWECLASFICSSTSNIPRIKLNVGAVATLGGRAGPGKHDFAFPPADIVAAAGEQRLRQLGLGFRARFLAPAAEAVASGRLNLNALRGADFLDARQALTELPGVGEKIADCVLAFSLDKPEAFPVDRHIQRALVRWYGLPANMKPSAAADWARSRFGQWGAMVQQYMFHRERMANRARDWGGRHLASALPEDR